MRHLNKREFEFSDGKSDKFWNIEITGASHTVTYGRKGTKGQSKIKDFPNPEAALKSYEKLIAQKTKKGYVEAQGGGTAVLAPPKQKETKSAPKGAEPSSQPEGVRWELIKWNKIHPRRCDGARVKLPKADACWKQIYKRCTKNGITADKGHDFAPQGPEMPEGPLDPEKEHRLAKTNFYSEWKNLPPRGFMGYWFAREGPIFCLEMLLRHTDLGDDGWDELRRYMAALDEDTYQKVLDQARGFRSREFTTNPRLTQVRLAFTFPDYTEWTEQAVDAWIETPGETGRHVMYLLGSMPTLEKIPEILGKLPQYANWHEVARHFLMDLVVQHGAKAVPALLQMLERCNTGGDRKIFARALTLIESVEVAQFFAGKLKDKELREIATAYLKQCPKVAASALEAEASPAAKELLRAAEARQADFEEASLEELPEVLRDPPWTRKKRAPVKVPEVAGLELLPFQEEVIWARGEREERLREYREEQKSSWRPRTENATEKALGGEVDFHGWLLYDVPDDLFLRFWCEMDLKRWLVEQITPDWDFRSHYDALALFGAEAIEGNLRFAAVNTRVGLPPLALVRSPRVAPLMVPHLAKRTKLRELAVSWLRTHSEAAAIGLLPQALGPKGKEQDAARAGLDILRGLGHTDLIRRVAAEYGQEASQATEVLLGEDLLLACPNKAPKMPKFLQPENLPRPILKNGKALPLNTLEHIVSMLSFTQTDPPYLGLSQLKDTCQSESLADFAWDLMEAWIDSGGAAAIKWALQGVGHLGDNGTARKLASAIRRWQREKQKARAMTGLEVLGLIGTDVALMYLSNFATKGISTKLREAAAIELKRVAARRALSLEELADRTAPNLGLDSDGGLTLELGSRTLSVSFDEHLKPRLRDESGWVARFPRAGKDDDKDKVKAASTRWKELVKDAESVASGQVARLEQAMCRRRLWTASQFREFLVDHPLLGHLTRRLIWAIYDTEGKVENTFRVCEDRSFADHQDDEYTLPEPARVGIPHPLECQALEQWGSILADYELLQPFQQLDREVFPYGPDRSVQGLKVPAKVLLSLNRRGWRLDHDSDSFSQYIKDLSGGNSARLDFLPGLDGDNFGGSGEQTLGSLRFYGIEASDLDPVEYSEMIRDLESLKL